MLNGDAMGTLQYHPVKTIGTALNIITNTSNKMILNQLRSAKNMLTYGESIVSNKSSYISSIDDISSYI